MDTTKKCATCKQHQPLAAFNKRQAARDGLQSRCRDCCRRWYEANRERHYAKVRQQKAARLLVHRRLLAQHFAENPCVDCGETDIRCLEFDHIDPSKKRSGIGVLVQSGMPWSTILTEIEKCEVRCANCHRRRTGQMFRSWRQEVWELAVDQRVRAAIERLRGVDMDDWYEQTKEGTGRNQRTAGTLV